jgi:hypothetical protein
MHCVPIKNQGSGSVFVLYSIHNVMKAEKVLKTEEIPFDTIPVPKEISPDCGMAILTASTDKPRARRVLTENGIDIKGIYLKTTSGYDESGFESGREIMNDTKQLRLTQTVTGSG